MHEGNHMGITTTLKTLLQKGETPGVRSHGHRGKNTV